MSQPKKDGVCVSTNLDQLYSWVILKTLLPPLGPITRPKKFNEMLHPRNWKSLISKPKALKT